MRLGMTTLKMSVNLSPIQIEQYQFTESLFQLLHELELQPEFLSLEITENILIEETTYDEGHTESSKEP